MDTLWLSRLFYIYLFFFAHNEVSMVSWEIWKTHMFSPPLCTHSFTLHKLERSAPCNVALQRRVALLEFLFLLCFQTPLSPTDGILESSSGWLGFFELSPFLSTLGISLGQHCRFLFHPHYWLGEGDEAVWPTLLDPQPWEWYCLFSDVQVGKSPPRSLVTRLRHICSCVDV